MSPSVGQTLIKTRDNQHREAQVTAITATHAILYWPDTDTQTEVKLERFGRTTEWRMKELQKG
jgi:hypothetical protein